MFTKFNHLPHFIVVAILKTTIYRNIDRKYANYFISITVEPISFTNNEGLQKRFNNHLSVSISGIGFTNIFWNHP